MNKIDAMLGFRTKFPSATLTRPANTTAYASGDVISDATGDAHFTFGSASDDGSKMVSRPDVGTITLNSVLLHSSANQATKLQAELWLFWADIANVADNAAFAPTDAEMLTLVTIVQIPQSAWFVGNAGSGANGNAVCVISNIDTPIKTSGNGRLYGQLVVRNAYTPVSDQVFTCVLGLSQD